MSELSLSASPSSGRIVAAYRGAWYFQRADWLHIKAMARPFFTYILHCADGSYYVGHTDELDRRMAQHSSGGEIGYTATRHPVELVWLQEFPSREEAKAVEVQIKKWSRRKKEALIAGEIEQLKQAARKDWAAHRRRRGNNT